MRHALVAMVVGLCAFGAALGEMPQVMGYQGRVTDNAGNPVADGNYTMKFRIYDNAGGSGDPIWDSGDRTVAVTGGVFSVMLGESPQPALSLPFTQDYWLLVTFAGEDQMPPRRLGSVGYAYMAGGLVPGTEVVGPVADGTKAAIQGTNTATTDVTIGVKAVTYSTDGRAILGSAVAGTGNTYGIWGLSNSTSGRGVHGYASATTGSTVGVWGACASPGGHGMYYSGGLAGTGSKSCVVKTSQGPTLLYCQESPECWFEDFGEGKLLNGMCHVELDAVFLEAVTIDEQRPMHVFIQPKGRCHGIYVQTGATGFDVVEQRHGTSDTRFSYRVVAKRKGFEDKRLDYCRAGETDPYLHPELWTKLLQGHEEEHARGAPQGP